MKALKVIAYLAAWIFAVALAAWIWDSWRGGKRPKGR